jgi:Zn-dependent peptidase ImmA (M78 family)
MPIGPVRNLIRWVESAGVIVFEEDFGTPRIDGMSQWAGSEGDTPAKVQVSSLLERKC